MATSNTNKTEVRVDKEGFLCDTQSWNENIARRIAIHEGIADLSSEKLKIVHFMRDYYFKHHNFPILGSVCRKVRNKSRDCVAEEFTDPMKAWKIAGLPKPPNIFFSTFDDKKYIANPFY